MKSNYWGNRKQSKDLKRLAYSAAYNAIETYEYKNRTDAHLFECVNSIREFSVMVQDPRYFFIDRTDCNEKVVRDYIFETMSKRLGQEILKSEFKYVIENNGVYTYTHRFIGKD